jgi:hypothetical protein
VRFARPVIRVSVPWCSPGHWRDVHIWLIDHVPNDLYDFEGADLTNDVNRIVRFSRGEDAVLFRLRWS